VTIASPPLDTGADQAQDFTGDALADRLVMNEHPLRLDLVSGSTSSLVALLEGPVAWSEVHVLDVDLDGSLDIHVSGGGPQGNDLLLMNDGAGHFSERAALIGLVEDTSLFDVSWSDVDGDGDPDLVLESGDGSRAIYENRLARHPGAHVSMLRAEPADVFLRCHDEAGRSFSTHRRLVPGAEALLGWPGDLSVEAWIVTGNVSERLSLTRGGATQIGP
jgi:hypothetical protein